MRKGLSLGIALAVALSLCACQNTSSDAGTTTAPTDFVPTTQAATVDPSVPFTELATEPSSPAHSDLYLPNYSYEQMWEYFEEVVLHMEYSDGAGNPSLVQKWNAPLHYRICGNPTDEDLAVLEDCFTQLNSVPGFPGIYAATEGEASNLTFHFLDPAAFRLAFSSAINGEDAYGAAQFWYYTATNEIHTANIGYRTDIAQSTRNSILIEEIINTLGISDTVLRTDSIVYQYSNENLTLSEVDWGILKLLYNPAIQCGMDYNQCRAIVQALYY